LLINFNSTLDDENILKFLGACITENNEILLVMEYMERGSLRDVLNKTEGKIDWKLKIRLCIDAAKGMEYLHNCKPPLIHRDIKSSNLLIDKKWRCKVAGKLFDILLRFLFRKFVGIFF
jgi:serine/threonine protein kinase